MKHPYHIIPSWLNRLVLVIILMISGVSVAGAQSGLEIDKIFNGAFSSDPRVTETFMSGNNKFLKAHKLTVFATLKAPAATYQPRVEKLVLADGSRATGKQIRYKDGKLYFALFILKPRGSGKQQLNRYLYYLNTAADKGSNILVVYLEGRLSEEEVSQLIQSIAKKSK